MAVPTYEQLLRPVLEILVDGQAKHWTDIGSIIAEKFDLSPEDVQRLTPSQRRTLLADRVQWALTYLRQAGLVERPSRASNRITAAGLAFLRSAPDTINRLSLMEFPEFVAFWRRSRSEGSRAVSQPCLAVELATAAQQITPDEAIEDAYRELNATLAQELLDRIKEMSPAFFERLIVRLMLKLGYGGTHEGAGQVTGKSGDGGVDGVISQDKLGLEKIYLQAKRYDDSSVDRKEIQAFVGALTGQGASKGVFITTSKFTKSAMEYVQIVAGIKVALLDGVQLAELMIEHDLGVSVVKRYDARRVDSDFFSEE